METQETNATNVAKDMWWELYYHIRQSGFYHERREAFFHRWHKLTLFCSIIFGTGAIYALFGPPESSTLAGIGATIVSVTSALDLVVDTSGQASIHRDLRRRFADIEVDQLGTRRQLTDDEIREIRGMVRDVEADEPPALPTIVDLAHNDFVLRAGKREDLKPINIFKRLVGHFG